MDFIINYFPSVVENFVILFFLTKFLQVKKNISPIIQKLVLIICVVLLCKLSDMGFNDPEKEMLYVFTAIIVCIIYSKLFTQGKMINCVFASLIPFVLIIMINSLLLYMFSTATNKFLEEIIYENSTPIYFINCVTTKGGLVLALSLIYRLNPRSNFVFKKNEVIAILSIFFSSLLVAQYIFATQVLNDVNGIMNSSIYYILALLGLLIINIFTYVSYLKIEKDNNKRIEYELMKIQLEQQKKSYEELEKKENEIRKVRHDLKNYMEACSALLEAKQYDKVKEYIDKVYQKEIKPINYSIIVHSLLINALLNNKIHTCEENNITVNYRILDEFSAFEELDMCVLLGNMWNNAIEATKDLTKEKKIIMEVYSKKEYLFIILKNTIEKSVLNTNPSLNTTKEDRKNHGYGIKSVKNIVCKYNGFMNITENNENIEFQIALKPNKIN